jgi:hypothetical protein
MYKRTVHGEIAKAAAVSSTLQSSVLWLFFMLPVPLVSLSNCRFFTSSCKSVLLQFSTWTKALSHMLERDERRLALLTRVNIEGGLPPATTLLRDLIRFLNQTKASRGKNIVTILEKMLELEKMTSPIKPEEPMIAALEWKRTDPKKFQVHWEIEKRRAMLQRDLSEYRFTPYAEVLMGGGGRGQLYPDR